MTEEELLKDMWHHLNHTIGFCTEEIRKGLKACNYNIDLAINLVMKDGPIDEYSGSYCESAVECQLSKSGYLRGWYPENRFSQKKPDIELNIREIFMLVRDNGIRASQPNLFGG